MNESTRTWERRTIVVLLLLVVVLLVWGLSCAPRLDTARSETDAGRLGADEHRGAFSVNGRVEATLSPGGESPIDLQFANRHDEPLELRRVEVTLREVEAPSADGRRGCGLDDFAVEQGDLAGLVVESEGEVDLSETDLPRARWPRLRMIDGKHNQDGCKDAGLVLAFEVDGVPA